MGRLEQRRLCHPVVTNGHTWPGGMQQAMTVDNSAGNAGMVVAVTTSCG